MATSEARYVPKIKGADGKWKVCTYIGLDGTEKECMPLSLEGCRRVYQNLMLNLAMTGAEVAFKRV